MRNPPSQVSAWASASTSASVSPNVYGRYDGGDELVEVTLDIQEDATVVLCSIEPADEQQQQRHPRQSSMVAKSGPLPQRSPPSFRRTTSSQLLMRSQELKAGAIASMRHVSNELTRLFSRSGSRSERQAGGLPPAGPSMQPALEAREERRRRVEQERRRPGANRALRGLRFISRNKANAWAEVEDKFNRLARDGFLARDDFVECIGMEDSKEFALELFDALSRRRRRMKVEKVNKMELHEMWKEITDNSFDSRLQIFFDMVDKDANGQISEAEVKEIIMLSASANRLSNLKEQAGEYAALIMEELDREGLGYIEIWQLETLLLQKDTYLPYSRAISFTSQTITQSLGLRREGPIWKAGNKLRYYVEDNWKRLLVLSLWIGTMIGLFTWKFLQYQQKYAFQVMGYCLCVAKGGAETLKLNMAIILLPVCRNTVTWLRGTWAASFLPFDDNINFHMTIAVAIAIGIILHAGDHLLCDFPRLISASPQKYAPLVPDFGATQPTYMDLVRGAEGVTGIIMLLCMIIAFTLASRWFRRGLVKLPKPLNMLTGYNAFWYSHHLFIIVYISYIIHTECLYLVHEWYNKTGWMYLAVPLSLYLSERILRQCRSGSYTVDLLKVAIYPGNVLTLQMTKPGQFRYKSGQYMFVKCNEISPFEWHPFSITSAPGDDYLSIHVRQVGDWTRDLGRVFKNACVRPEPGKSGLLRADWDKTTGIIKNVPRLQIDGPYGAPAQDNKKYDVMLLIGLGIGATPFISILKDLLNSIVKMDKDSKMEEKLEDLYPPVGKNGGQMDLATLMKITESSSKVFRTTHAYFYWVTREQGSFDWFKGVMNEVAELDQTGIIDMHNYLTSVYEEGDARSALITMLQVLNQMKNGVDVVSGTRVRTHFAKPNWKRVLSQLASKHPNAKIGVFYCGTPALVKELRELCTEVTARSTTKFEFHKENF